MSQTTAQPTNTQAMARAAADQYFDALASDIPFDVAPGEVNLIEGLLLAQRATMIGRVLQALSTATDADASDLEALGSLGLVAMELAADIAGLHAAYVTEANTAGGAR
jgi:hypothetical protein